MKKAFTFSTLDLFMLHTLNVSTLLGILHWTWLANCRCSNIVSNRFQVDLSPPQAEIVTKNIQEKMDTLMKSDMG